MLVCLMFAVKLTEEQIKLLRYQTRLEEEFNKPYLDLSVHQTVHQLLLSNNQKVVEQMRKEFRIPDRRSVT
jgi:vacuolar protein sorting-associated protein 16